jgi:excinuclease UvrABC ATPase subunit
LLIDGKEIDISEDVEIDETCEHEMEVIVDKFILKRGIEKQVLVGNPKRVDGR